MAGVPGNQWTLAVGRQSAKGTPQTTPLYKLKAVGGDIDATRTTLQLAETDATRQQGATLVVGGAIQGSIEHYLRPDDFATIAYASLGANVDSGATNFTHTATPASSGPYHTLYKAVGATSMVDRYSDCRVTQLRVAGSAGGVLTYTVDWAGLDYLLGQTDPVLTAVSQTPLVYPQATVTRAGSAPGTYENFDLTISNGGAYNQGDKQLMPYDFTWGKLGVQGTLTMLFESDADHRLFLTGSTSGTIPTTTLTGQTLSIIATVNANLSVEFVMAGVAMTSYVVSPDAGGDPLKAAIGFYSQPQAAIADYLKIITKNQVAVA